jgi:purine-binding chemotaxis protein CheW
VWYENRKEKPWSLNPCGLPVLLFKNKHFFMECDGMEQDGKNFLSPDRILTEVRKSLKTRNVVDVEEDQVKMVVLAVGGQRYALHGKDVKEILQGREIHPVPFLPTYIPGLVNVRGEIEAAIDLGRLLGSEKRPHPKGLIAMVQKGRFRAAMLVDEVVDVVDIPLTRVGPPLSSLSGVLRELVSGTVEFSGEALALLDVEKLVARVTP